MSNRRKGWSGESSWKAWTSPTTVLALLAAIAMLGYMVFYRIPDIEKQLERSRTENAERTKGWEREQHERFNRIEGQLVKVRTNLLRLCMRGKQPEKDCQVNDLVATVSDVTSLQAQLLVSAKMDHPAGQTPTITSPELRGAIASNFKYPGGIATSSKTDIANLMAWSSSAKDAQWTVKDGALTVRFSNGTAVFQPHPSVSAELLNQAAADLNTMSSAVHAVTAAQDIQTQTYKPPPKPQVPEVPGGSIQPLPGIPTPTTPFIPRMLDLKPSAK